MTKQESFDFLVSTKDKKASDQADPSAGAGPAEPVPPAPPPGGVPVSSLQAPLGRLFDSNFLQYASYVIRDRAIPNLDDGLKPVQRRILYSLHEKDDGRFIKVANIVGYCMQYHPHGDASIEDALVTLTNRGYLIEGQGNFGNLFTGDPAAAARYIECRLTDLARKELFHDELTRFVASYDGRSKEPVTLPAKIPLLLMLGAEGIAVGLSTRILPHNFPELLEAQIAILEKKPFSILPDFPQGGLMDASEYNRGNGRVRLRARIEPKDAETLVIREIPYGTTTDSLIASVEEAARKGRIRIKSISDFTSEKIEIEIKLKEDAGAGTEKILQSLYAFTDCEVSLACRLTVIRNHRPAEMSADEVLRHNTGKLVRDLEKELKLEQAKLQDELHFRTLVEIFVENRIYSRIESCKTLPDIQQAVLGGFEPFRPQLKREITARDVERLLEIKIRRISLFDMNQHRREMEKIASSLAEIEKNLASIVPYTIRYLKDLMRRHKASYPRRTRVTTFEAVQVRELAAQPLEVGFDRERGYLGHAVKAETTLACTSFDRILLVWGDGRYKVITPPEKLFVDGNLLYFALADRDKVFTLVYRGPDQITYVKRFAFGGTILNKEYACVPPGSAILLFLDRTPEEIYVKYEPAKGQKIHQQVFHPPELPVKGVKARGSMLTLKKVASIGTRKPRNWDEVSKGPRGAVF
ncbi:MAG: DNA topoisomerase IV subunit A [bacterium]